MHKVNSYKKIYVWNKIKSKKYWYIKWEREFCEWEKEHKKSFKEIKKKIIIIPYEIKEYIKGNGYKKKLHIYSFIFAFWL